MRWEWQGLKIPIIILALVVGLVTLFGGHWAYRSYGYNQPLIQVLEQEELITAYELDEKAPVLRVVVELKPGENLMETYQGLERKLQHAAPNREFELLVRDNRDTSLDQAYYRSQFAIHQAIQQGNFQDMVAVVEENARQAGAEARVYLDSDRVYIQMETGDHHLAEVIPRGPVLDLNGALRSGGGLYVQRG